MVVLLQRIKISNHYVVPLEVIKRYVSYISVKVKIKNKMRISRPATLRFVTSRKMWNNQDFFSTESTYSHACILKADQKGIYPSSAAFMEVMEVWFRKACHISESFVIPLVKP